MSRAQEFSRLTARQELFATTFAVGRNLKEAYCAAYDHAGLSEKVIDKRAREVLATPAVADRIRDLIDEAVAPTVFTLQEALARFLAIACADPNELISLKIGCCRFCHGDEHRYQWREREYLDAMDKWEADARYAKEKSKPEPPMPDVGGGFGFDASMDPHAACPECHGEGSPRVVAKDTENLSPAGRLLYGGVKQTNNGPQIIIADRAKALEVAAKLAGFFTEKVQVDANLRAQVQAVTTTTTDPNEAARLYQQMITGIAS